MVKSELLFVGMNLIVCLIGLGVCVSRMACMTSRSTKLTIRVQYAVWMGYFVASALSWAYDEPASFTQLVMTGAVLGHLLLGANAWRYGAPSYTYRGRVGCD